MLLAPRAMFVLRVHNRWVFRCGAEIEARKILLFHLPLPPLPVWQVSQKKEEDSSVDHQPPPKFDALYISYPSLLRNVLGEEADQSTCGLDCFQSIFESLHIFFLIRAGLVAYKGTIGDSLLFDKKYRPITKNFVRGRGEGLKECLSIILAGHSRSKRGMREKEGRGFANFGSIILSYRCSTVLLHSFVVRWQK